MLRSVAVGAGDLMETALPEQALLRGGHLHVGFEEFVRVRRPSNVEVLEECVALAANSVVPL